MVINQMFVLLCRGEGSDISFCLRADGGAGSKKKKEGKKMALEIKEDIKVVRYNIHWTCMMVRIDVAGHGFHIIQQGLAIA